jgi:hypothetical protein
MTMKNARLLGVLLGLSLGLVLGIAQWTPEVQEEEAPGLSVAEEERLESPRILELVAHEPELEMGEIRDFLRRSERVKSQLKAHVVENGEEMHRSDGPGNQVRRALRETPVTHEEALAYFESNGDLFAERSF